MAGTTSRTKPQEGRSVMPEDTTTTNTSAIDSTSTDTSQADTSGQQSTDTGSGNDEVKRLRAEAAKYRVAAKENAAAKAELDALKESQKSEAQKLADRATQAEKERDEARLDNLRLKVGVAKKLPADVVDLLKGDTEDELAAHADRLAEHFKASVRPSGSADQGPRGTAPTADPREAMAAFLKDQLRQ